MRTHDSTPDSVVADSRALRDRDASGAPLRIEDLGDVVVETGALYLGARSGENGVDGVVVRIPRGAYRVLATIDDRSGTPETVALSVALSGTSEALRGALPGGAFWHEAPGDLPLMSGNELAVSDAGIRDQYHDPNWPWDGWLRDVVDPTLTDARTSGQSGVAVPFPGRDESIIFAAPIAGDVALFAAFDDERRPTAIHLEALVNDAPPPWVGQTSAWQDSDQRDEAPADASFADAAQGQSSFGQAAFGQPATFGQPAAFADPAANQEPPTPSPFGQGPIEQPPADFSASEPSQFEQGQFGQAPFGQSPFGQPAPDEPHRTGSHAAEPPFGQPSDGQSSFGRSAFGAAPSTEAPIDESTSIREPERPGHPAHADHAPFAPQGNDGNAGPAANGDAWSSDAPDENQQISAAALGPFTGEQAPIDAPPQQSHDEPAPAAPRFGLASAPDAPVSGPFGQPPAPQPDTNASDGFDQAPAFGMGSAGGDSPAPSAAPAPLGQASDAAQDGAQAAPPLDPGAERLAADATAGVEAIERRDAATGIPLLIQVTDALASGIGERPAVQAALASASLTGAQLVDTLVDALLSERQTDEAMNRLRGALEHPHLRGRAEETVHLRRRLGDLQLRSGDLDAATATLETARGEADALTKQTGPDSQETAEVGRHYLAHITYDLATSHLRAGGAGPAAELAVEATRSFEELHVARMAGRSAFLAASAYEALGHEASRQQSFSRAERIFRQGHELDGLGTALGFLGEADAVRGDYVPALNKFEQARAALEEAGELGNAAIAAENEAVCFEHLGQHNDAAERRQIATRLEERAAAV